MKESLGTLVVSASLESRFYCGLSTDLVSIINFTKLIDKKIERCLCTMKETLEYIKSNVKCG